MSLKEKLGEAAADALLFGSILPGKGMLVNVLDSCDKVAEEIDRQKENHQNRKTEKFLRKTSGHRKLIAQDQKNIWGKTCCIYDEKQYLRYCVKGKVMAVEQVLSILDADTGKELAAVKEKRFVRRPVAGVESGAKNFEVQIGGENLGVITTKAAYRKKVLQMSFCPWTAEGDVSGKEFRILSEESHEMMKITRKETDTGALYYLDVSKPEYEILGVVLMMAVRLIS